MAHPKVAFDEMTELRALINMESPDSESGKHTKVLAKKVAEVYINHGRREAVTFLMGYWFGTGVRSYDATVKVAEVFGLSVKDGDLSD